MAPLFSSLTIFHWHGDLEREEKENNSMWSSSGVYFWVGKKASKQQHQERVGHMQVYLFSLSFALLCFMDTVGFSVMLSNSITTICPRVFAYICVNLSHFGNSCNIKKNHYYSICFCDLWSVICAVTIAKRLQVTEVSVSVF